MFILSPDQISWGLAAMTQYLLYTNILRCVYGALYDKRISPFSDIIDRGKHVFTDRNQDIVKLQLYLNRSPEADIPCMVLNYPCDNNNKLMIPEAVHKRNRR